jgi:hypothetical protein
MEGVKSGYLNKRGSLVRNWKKRLFELDYKQEVLRYKDPSSGVIKGEVKLNGSWVQHVDKAITKHDHCFELVGKDKRLLMQASSDEEAHDWASALDEVARSANEKLRTSALRCMGSLNISSAPLGQYLGYKCCTVRMIEGLGYYIAQDGREEPQTLYVFEVFTDQSMWKMYKRFSKFHDAYCKLCTFSHVSAIAVPALPSKSITKLSEADMSLRFKDLFDWLQIVLDRLMAGCARLLIDGFAKHKNAQIFKQAHIFFSFLSEGANCPPKPGEGMLDDWATPTDWDMPELNEMAQRLDLNYDPIPIGSVPWMQHASSPQGDSNVPGEEHHPTGRKAIRESRAPIRCMQRQMMCYSQTPSQFAHHSLLACLLYEM